MGPRHHDGRFPMPPAGPGVPDRAGGVHLSDLCRRGEHGRCRHPANALRSDGCDCTCHERAVAA